MLNLIGRAKILKKSISIKILILASIKEIKIFDLFYVLACTYIYDEAGEKLQNMQSINPILYIKNELKNSLVWLHKNNLIFFSSHLIKLTYKGDVYVKAIKNENLGFVNVFIAKVNYCANDCRKLYLKFEEGTNQVC